MCWKSRRTCAADGSATACGPAASAPRGSGRVSAAAPAAPRARNVLRSTCIVHHEPFPGCDRDDLRARARAEDAHELGDAILHRARAEVDLLADLAVGAPLRQQLDDLEVARGEAELLRLGARQGPLDA